MITQMDFERSYPDKPEMITMLKASLEYVRSCDSHSDFDWELGRWQRFLSKCPLIIDEDGSL